MEKRNVSILSDEISKRIRQIDRTIAFLEGKRKRVPEGHIRVSKSAGNYRYYHVTEKNCPSGEYLKRSKTDLAKTLVQKDYENKVLKSLHAERDVLLKANNIYKSGEDHFYYGPEERIWQNLTEGRKRHPRPFQNGTDHCGDA